MASRRPLIFVSYSHEDCGTTDRNIAEKVFRHLQGRDEFTTWVDQSRIRAGDEWSSEIDRALASADLAVLLISPAFLASSFIREKEQPRLWKRHVEHGLRLVPIVLEPCEPPGWLARLEMRPRGGSALSEIYTRDPASVDRSLQQIMKEIIGMLGPSPASRRWVRSSRPCERNGAARSSRR